MEKNPDAYLLYECSKKVPFTVRMKYILDAPIDASLLKEAAQAAFARFPYFSVRVRLDAGQSYVLEPNEAPLPVLPEPERALRLASAETAGHLFAITWRGKAIWFNFSHSICGGFGALFWVKTTLYEYMRRKYGPLQGPADLKEATAAPSDGELAWPDVEALPADEPAERYTGGSTLVGISRMIKYLANPFARDSYYYELEIPASDFMDYARSIDASPNSGLCAMIYKAAARHFKEKEGQHLSVRIADDYRADVGCPESYRDFVRLIHVKYDWSDIDTPIAELNARSRAAIRTQALPELSYERMRKVEQIHREIDAQPTLKAKRKYAARNSMFRNDDRDVCSLSYVGQVDYGQMAEHITGIYTITDGDMIFEVNALPNKFCIAVQMIDKDPELTERFCQVLREEGIPFTLGERMTRRLPIASLPKA